MKPADLKMLKSNRPRPMLKPSRFDPRAWNIRGQVPSAGGGRQAAAVEKAGRGLR